MVRVALKITKILSRISLRPILFCTLPINTFASTENMLWSGDAGGYKVEWTANAIKAKKEADLKTIFIAGEPSAPTPSPSAINKVEKADPEDDDELGDLNASFHTLLSLVGPYASLRVKQVVQLAPRASTQVFIEHRLVHLGDPSKEVSIAEIFPPEDIFQALMADKVIKRVLKKNKQKVPLKDLPHLINFLSQRNIESGRLTKIDSSNGDSIFPSNLLSAASFHHIEKNQVAVRLHLQAENAKYQNPKSIGILLMIPDSIAKDVHLAAIAKNGFLTGNAPRDKSKEFYESRVP